MHRRRVIPASGIPASGVVVAGIVAARRCHGLRAWRSRPRARSPPRRHRRHPRSRDTSPSRSRWPAHRAGTSPPPRRAAWSISQSPLPPPSRTARPPSPQRLPAPCRVPAAGLGAEVELVQVGFRDHHRGDRTGTAAGAVGSHRRRVVPAVRRRRCLSRRATGPGDSGVLSTTCTLSMVFTMMKTVPMGVAVTWKVPPSVACSSSCALALRRDERQPMRLVRCKHTISPRRIRPGPAARRSRLAPPARRSRTPPDPDLVVTVIPPPPWHYRIAAGVGALRRHRSSPCLSS